VLKHPTLTQLHALGLHGMAKAFDELAANGQADGLDRLEWLTLLLDREASLRQDKRFTSRLRAARLRQQAAVEDVDYRSPRGLDRALFQKLAEGDWIKGHDNLVLVGPTGVGKSWLAAALGHKACRDNQSVLYQRVPRLFEDLALGRGDGRHPRLLRSLGRADLLILDDWGLEPLDAGARHDLLEILEERYGRRSTMITSQLPVDRWHDIIGDPHPRPVCQQQRQPVPISVPAPCNDSQSPLQLRFRQHFRLRHSPNPIFDTKMLLSDCWAGQPERWGALRTVGCRVDTTYHSNSAALLLQRVTPWPLPNITPRL
jgi:DNA replication protein DnaC